MSAFFNNQGQQSKAELMENYMQFCLFQKQQEQQKEGNIKHNRVRHNQNTTRSDHGCVRSLACSL